MDQVMHAFINGKSTASGKNQYRDDQCPEVQLLSVAERMSCVWRTAAPALAQKQKQTISRIHQRMHTFRQHGGAAGKGCSNEFDRRNRKISCDRSEYHSFPS